MKQLWEDLEKKGDLSTLPTDQLKHLRFTFLAATIRAAIDHGGQSGTAPRSQK